VQGVIVAAVESAEAAFAINTDLLKRRLAQPLRRGLDSLPAGLDCLQSAAHHNFRPLFDVWRGTNESLDITMVCPAVETHLFGGEE
jgi:hypothetical protein